MPDIDKRTELQQLLDLIVKTDNKIDTAFVFETKHGKILYFGKPYTYGKQFSNETTVRSFESWLGRLKDTPQTLSKIELGDMKYLVIPFDNGLLSLYFEDKQFASPIIIGFAYQGTDGESAMGEMLYNADVAVKKIKDLLRELS